MMLTVKINVQSAAKPNYLLSEGFTMRPFYYSNHSPYYNKPFIIEQWRRVDSTLIQYADGPCHVSTLGRVYNENRRSIVKAGKNSDGYSIIPVKFIYPDGTSCTKSMLLSRLIMLSFAPIENSEMYEVNHNNGDKDKNCIYNLSWCTRAENNLFCHMNGLRIQPKGTNHYKSELTEEEVDTICILLKRGMSCKEIANIIGCTPQIVSHILNGTTYKNATIKHELYKYRSPRNMNRLSDENIKKVKIFMESNRNNYKTNKDLYIAALNSVGYPNPSKDDRALITYMRRIDKTTITDNSESSTTIM